MGGRNWSETRNRMGWLGVDLSGPGKQVAGCCEHGNEHSGTINARNFLSSYRTVGLRRMTVATATATATATVSNLRRDSTVFTSRFVVKFASGRKHDNRWVPDHSHMISVPSSFSYQNKRYVSLTSDRQTIRHNFRCSPPAVTQYRPLQTRCYAM